MRFQAPLLLWLALPWLVGWLLYARAQRRALAWVLGNVSRRFRSRFSVHTPATLGWHLRLLAMMGLLLIVAAARPYRPGAAEIEAERARVVLIFDASASMFATDLGTPAPGADATSEQSQNRFEHARAAGRMLIEALPETSFALVSFSGSAALHTPMSADRGFLLDAVRGLEIHGQYQTTGSSLAGALDSIFEFQDPTRPNLQAVILSDGEQPVAEELGDTLEALAGHGVPVHTVAIGTTEGQSRLIYDFRDIVADKENPAVLRQYHTSRVDESLRAIAAATGGRFEVLEAGALVRLADAIEEYRSPPARIERTGTGTDLGVYCLLAFLAGLVLDGLVIGRRPRRAPLRFEIDRLGAGGAPSRRAAALLLGGTLLFSSACANTPRARAYRENEQGIALDLLRRHADARVHYQRSIGYGVEPQIPTFNLARSVHREGGYSEAHELYQRALTLDPKLPEAYYNDGVALFDWGAAEIDPRGCELERTRELWTGALQRFARTVELTRATQATGRMARANRAALEQRLAEVERLIADPPPECRTGGGGDSAESDSENEEQGGGGGGGDDQEGQGQGGGRDQEDQGQGGGRDQEEDQGQGGGRDQEEDQGQGGGGDQEEDQGQGGGGDQDDEDQGQGGGRDREEDRGQGGGGDQDDEDQGQGRSGSPPPLGPEELERIGQELERIARQGREAGKFHRRTLPEQFSREHWANPDRVIWW